MNKSDIKNLIREELLKEMFTPDSTNTGLATYGASKTFIYFNDPSGKREYIPTKDEFELWSIGNGKIKDILARMWYPKSKLDTNKSAYYPED